MTTKPVIPQVDLTIRDTKKEFARFSKYAQLVKKNEKDKEEKSK